MKYHKIILVLSIYITACRKHTSEGMLSSFTIVNALADGSMIISTLGVPDTSNNFNQHSISSGNFQTFSPASGSGKLSIDLSGSTGKPLLTTSLSLAPGGMYSLYITGTANRYDTLLATEKFIQYPDSITGIRYVNLVSDSRPVDIFIQGKSTPEVSNLAYRQSTSFITYYLANLETDHLFEIHDAISDSVLAIYGLSLMQHKNQTLVVYGSENPLDNLTVNAFQVNNY